MSPERSKNGSALRCAPLWSNLKTSASSAAPFDAKGEVDPRTFSKSKFEKWLEFLPPQVGYKQEDQGSFLLAGDDHKFEYVSPLHINGVIKGAVVVGFAEPSDFNGSKGSLIEAATQMAAMSVNLSAHYEAAINNSINRAKEEHRRFTEAVLDALPVSLYVVDRDFRIVTWNRHRENGDQGIPRDTALGRNVFSVLARYPEGRVREEFERAFRTGKIERIEQQTARRRWLDQALDGQQSSDEGLPKPEK